MKITTPKFLTSVASKDKFLKASKPIVAITGKSNVGKSSLINMLSNNKKLAKTSDTPGRTRLINYFDFGEFILADLPGYGYAKVSKEEKEKWGDLMEEFLQTQKLSLIISLIDIRHDPTADDIMMIEYLYHYRLPFIIVATKSDKLAKSKIKPQLNRLATCLKVGISNIISSSAENGDGKSAIFSAVEQAINVKNGNEE